jgi:hypothetical protein
VGGLRDGILTAICEFDIEFETQAFAYTEELTQANASRLVLANRACTVFQQLAQAMMRGDAQAASERVGDGYVLDDRRRYSGDPIQGRIQAQRALERILAQFSHFERRVLAVRGENLVLYSSQWSDDSGNETAHLHLLELDAAELIGCEARFDPDDFDGAYRELEERYYAGEGSAAARSGLNNADYVAAMNQGDFDTMFTELSWPDLRVENRSRSGFPDRSATELRASLVELAAMVASVHAWFSTIRWLSPDLFVGRMDREGVGHDGERYTWARVLVGVYRDGRLAILCDFDAEDEDAAFTYANETL